MIILKKKQRWFYYRTNITVKHYLGNIFNDIEFACSENGISFWWIVEWERSYNAKQERQEIIRALKAIISDLFCLLSYVVYYQHPYISSYKFHPTSPVKFKESFAVLRGIQIRLRFAQMKRWIYLARNKRILNCIQLSFRKLYLKQLLLSANTF